MELNIAKISFDPKVRRMTNITFINSNLRFRCQRCAVFCCKLGAPPLSESDIERLKKAGYYIKNFIDVASTEDTLSREKKSFLKHKEDGSCIFLQQDEKRGPFTCSIYEIRPSLCRLYPFEFAPTGSHTGVLRLIPCCNGLDAKDSEPIDREFIEENLLEAIIDCP